MMTPDYASPEQVSGRPSTTATDVYSLGVLLYVLLTGARPYTLTGTTPAAIEKQLLEFTLIPPERARRQQPRVEHPRRPPRAPPAQAGQAAARAISTPSCCARSDALPSSRYSSVEQLAEDVARHRAHHPVQARGRTVGYAARLFVRRHRAAIAVAAADRRVLVVGGIVGVLWQASIAADARRRAERRFDDVRALAGSFIFDVHDAIDNVPGTTPARQLIVQRAVQYLESLAREAGGDAGLQRELARAFIRVGDAQGNPTRANVGDPTGAIGQLSSARLRWPRRCGPAAPATSRRVRTLALAYRQRGDVLAVDRRQGQGARRCRRTSARPCMHRSAARDDATLEDRVAVGVAPIKLGDLLGNPNFENLGRAGSANLAYAQALATFRSLDRGTPNDLRVRRYLGIDARAHRHDARRREAVDRRRDGVSGVVRDPRGAGGARADAP